MSCAQNYKAVYISACCHKCDANRYRYKLGPNTKYDVIALWHFLLLRPGDRVVKVGRTTGLTEGPVNGTTFLSWQDGQVTAEIAVVDDEDHSPFANKGDSGALCMVVDGDGQWKVMHAT